MRVERVTLRQVRMPLVHFFETDAEDAEAADDDFDVEEFASAELDD